MPKVWWCQMSNLEAPLIFNMRIQNVPFYVDSIWCWWLPKFMVNHSYYATVSPQLTESEGSNVASRWSSRCGKMFCYLAVFGQFSNPLLLRDGSWSWLNNNNMHLAILTWSPTWHCINLLLNSSAVQFQNPQPPLSPNTPRGTWLSGLSMPRRALSIHCILSEGSTLPRQTGKIC